ncbi:hypothetical protein VCHA56P521_60061 [Vibrio chagasii]|nr:hypothetical protein VCHA31O71_10208 [Vibrio chagasii]CAH6838099.1 hypothetical protein VCHA35O137_10205 [Vibrio chagasii]CAH6858398.1 hypothetical protein VCHA32P90_10922 [Vibrio chagasii]CAH6862995.1 hypothetical protein VCHA34P116_10923 [Vibrio chagasii]CAH6896591.1 hypothetical protein VCHA54P489_100129 [Vibrio chagasii]
MLNVHKRNSAHTEKTMAAVEAMLSNHKLTNVFKTSTETT